MADKGLSLYDNLARGRSDNAAEIKRISRDWAAHYDADNDGTLGTVSQPTMVHFLANYITDKSLKLLDVGCGTGLVGQHLKQAGFTQFDGTDISDKMLEQATLRGYDNLFLANIVEGLPVADDAYEACLCVGVFTHGHVGPEGFDELTRITKKGGFIGFTVNEDVFYKDGFDNAIARFVADGLWDIKLHQISDYMTKKNVKGIYVIAEVR